jgi:hypothetical protein
VNNVGRKGQKSVQFGFKTTEEIAKKMEEERAIDETTLAGFINDAIKHYIDYRENKRINLWKMRKESPDGETGAPIRTDHGALAPGGNKVE